MVTRIHGQYVRVLMSSTTTGPFSILGSVNSVTLNRDTDKADTTAFGDSTKNSAAGLPNADVDFNGLYDLDDTVLTAARAVTTGVMIGIYPNYVADKTKYWAALVDVDFGYNAEITAAQKINGKATARASAIDHL